jgi:micrococcal nuclease
MKSKLFFILLCTVFSFSQQTYAAEGEITPPLVGKMLRAYDGDTIFVTLPNVHPVFGANIGIRLNNIDTPEMTGDCAKEKDLANKAKERVTQLLPTGSEVTLQNVKRDKYFRVLADVYAQGIISVNNTLLLEKLAVPYTGGEKYDWCAEQPRAVIY